MSPCHRRRRCPPNKSFSVPEKTIVESRLRKTLKEEVDGNMKNKTIEREFEDKENTKNASRCLKQIYSLANGPFK